MTVARALDLARKVFTRPPGYTLERLGQEARRAARRPWSRVYPSLVTDRRLLGQTGGASVDALWADLACGPFFLTPADRDRWVAAFRAGHPAAEHGIVAAADRILRHEFDLLGSGPRRLGPTLPWHEDFKTGRVWPPQYSPDIEYAELDRPSDVKVPWELSRCQHFSRLGQAYWLTGDERYAQEYVDEVSDWIDRNPWGYGVNWACAMDVALRAVNWIWGFYFFAGSQACAGQGFRSRLLRSLFLHGEYVATHLEKGPVNGNHYLSDGVGLVFLGCFFRRSRKGEAWRDLGRAIVLDEMLRQVTADGVDFEASTAYHRLVLELFLTACLLLRLHGETIPASQWARLERMFEFVEAYVKPDGLAPLVGDADDGRVQILGLQPIGDHRYLLAAGAVLFERGDFKRAAGRFWEESFWLLGPGAAGRFCALAPPAAAPASKAFPLGGFFVLRDGETHVFIDCGNVGMQGLGGHGHNDILSFELVLDGVRLVTDSGAYLYTASRDWRNRFRSTAFHGTIQVDGEEVNRFVEPDALWRLHDDATPDGVSFEIGPRGDRFRGAHLGYRRLSSPVRVIREVVLATGRSLVAVADVLEGTGRHEVVWRFPLEPGWVSPSYGVRRENQVLTLRGVLQLPHRATYFFSSRPASHAARLADLRAVGLG